MTKLEIKEKLDELLDKMEQAKNNLDEIEQEIGFLADQITESDF